jgi:hypothetical protein
VQNLGPCYHVAGRRLAALLSDPDADFLFNDTIQASVDSCEIGSDYQKTRRLLVGLMVLNEGMQVLSEKAGMATD